MRNRDYKPNYAGAVMHAYNRGVNKGLIFLDDQDYKNFLYRAKIITGSVPLPKRSAKGSIRLSVLPAGAVNIFSYCLMPNHFHFLIRQNQLNGIKMFFQRLCTSYAVYFYKKYNRVGHIFQGVYKSKQVLHDSYLLQLASYIHLNPANPFTWKYSSLPVYLKLENDTFVHPEMINDSLGMTPEKYKEFLITKFDKETLIQGDLLFEED